MEEKKYKKRNNALQGVSYGHSGCKNLIEGQSNVDISREELKKSSRVECKELQTVSCH